MRDDYPSEPGPFERYYLGYYLGTGTIAAAGIVVIVLAVVGFFFFLAGSSSPTTNRGGGPGRVEESGIESARQSLARQTDLNTCRGALQQINSELNARPDRRPPALTKEQKEWLQKHAGLDSGELAEIDSGNYTQLDGHHLDSCFLLRDAASTLEVKGVRAAAGGAGVRETALQRAASAFAWVVREVRLREHGGEAVPPAFVLRRGWGSAFERALVFLALLEQISDPSTPHPELLGCLLYVPNEPRGFRFWTCGVVVGDGKDVYLFDPRLGLPLPPPLSPPVPGGDKGGGQGVATLSEFRKQAEARAQLQIGKYRYDVTAEQARKTRALLICSLSSLAPRMRHLQERLLAPVVRVRLAADPMKDLERLKAACAGGADTPTPVELWKRTVGLLRRFLPPDEGGVDKGVRMALAELRGFTLPDDPAEVLMPRRQRYIYEQVPWTAMPAQFQDNNRFPYNIGLGQRVRDTFARPFILSALEPGHPRDLLLRGRWSKAVPELVREADHWREEQKRRANALDVDKRANEWVEQAIHVYADQLRAKLPEEREAAEREVRSLWAERRAEPIYLLLNSAIAAARTPEVTYLLGLCAQEQAEQLQARIDLPARAPGGTPHPADVEKTRHAWQDALYTWKKFTEDYPQRGGRAAARRLRGRAESMLGDGNAAVTSWEDLSGDMTALEKLASLYQAQQLKKQHTK